MTTPKYFCSVAALILAPLLILAGCGKADSDDQRGASTGSPQNKSTPAPDGNDKQDSADESVALNHSDALTAGFAGKAPITCVYTFDADELKGMKTISNGGWTTPVADIFLDGATVYWEIPQAGNRVSHILALGKNVYAWKLPGDDKGAIGENTDGDLAVLKKRLPSHASDCKVYTGPLSIFKVPAGISF